MAAKVNRDKARTGSPNRTFPLVARSSLTKLCEATDCRTDQSDGNRLLLAQRLVVESMRSGPL